jgi:hypothetical protein
MLFSSGREFDVIHCYLSRLTICPRRIKEKGYPVWDRLDFESPSKAVSTLDLSLNVDLFVNASSARNLREFKTGITDLSETENLSIDLMETRKGQN